MRMCQTRVFAFGIRRAMRIVILYMASDNICTSCSNNTYINNNNIYLLGLSRDRSVNRPIGILTNREYARVCIYVCECDSRPNDCLTRLIIGARTRELEMVKIARDR